MMRALGKSFLFVAKFAKKCQKWAINAAAHIVKQTNMPPTLEVTATVIKLQ